ncbi:unnamed protein product [Orchesella dallaii]|uniref:Uncharacterized protein n=1 Tax=Orchesella dallaii TaxID=48710 RepID=A0ABP1S0P7_9HEXA
MKTIFFVLAIVLGVAWANPVATPGALEYGRNGGHLWKGYIPPNYGYSSGIGSYGLGNGEFALGNSADDTMMGDSEGTSVKKDLSNNHQ